MFTSLYNLDHRHALPLFLLHLQFSSAMAQPQYMGPPLPEDPFANLTFDKTMTRLLVILVVAIFLFGFVSIYTRQCMERRTTGRITLGVPITGGSVSLPTRGLDKETIENLPNFVYSDVKGLKIGKVTLECAVCLSEFLDDETLRLIPKCSHVFHRDCIDVWLANHSTCPVCRATLLPKPNDMSSSIAIEISEPGGLGTNLPEPEANHNLNAVSRVDECNRVAIITDSSRVDLDEMNLPVRSKSMGFGIGRLFSRSHSMGRRNVDCERFTLRLPEEEQNRLVKSVTKSWSITLPSGRSGYRTRSVGRSYLHYERFDEETQLDRRRFMCTPSFLGRAISMRANQDANKAAVVVDEVGVGEHSSDRLF